jgi:hypothetical protein
MNTNVNFKSKILKKAFENYYNGIINALKYLLTDATLFFAKLLQNCYS